VECLHPGTPPAGRPVPVTDGVLIANGAAPDTERSPVPGADLIYNGTGTDNCFAGNVFGTDFRPA
jgi:hypothetical protein